MNNLPEIRLGIVAVSRDCFPKDFSAARCRRVTEAFRANYGELYECPICVEHETEVPAALRALAEQGCNALCIYFGNFGPETPSSLLAEKFRGPVMAVGAAEEDDLIQQRGDAYCGLLNFSYSIGMRKVRVYFPEYPIGTPEECAQKIAEFLPVARGVVGVHDLKIISFGPRPQDFVACNAPIQPLYDLGVKVEENSELDLYASFLEHEADPRIAELSAHMAAELGAGNQKPEVLPKLAQYELTLTDWIREHRGSSSYVALAGKCWPAFQTQFGFVPCYVNSRLTSRGIPVACEVDLFGALSEYLGMCITGEDVTLMDINNSVPKRLYTEQAADCGFRQQELFMGFHCGNAPIARMKAPVMSNQLIMARSLPPEKTNGTLEGSMKAGNMTAFRLHGAADGTLCAYTAEGSFLDVEDRSFGSRGVIGISEMDRFYRHVLLERHFPHHAAVAFSHCGKSLFEAMRLLGVPAERIYRNQPASERYLTE